MKYFLISDIHSYYTEMKASLDSSGFNKDNPEHILVVLGDVFDRGDETIEVYNFLKSLPEDRCILIRGNHEELFLSLLNRSFPTMSDLDNGTVRTFVDIAGYSLVDIYDIRYALALKYNYDTDISSDVRALWIDIKTKVKKSEIVKWLKSKQWRNYYEFDKYICVHSFIPLKCNPEQGISALSAVYNGWTFMFESLTDWRNATKEEWQLATWGCPYQFFEAGFFNKEKEQGKVLVCGHYGTKHFNDYYLNMPENNDIYFGKNLIAIDATTAASGQVNVLVIDGNNCYDQNKNKLEIKKPWPKIETVTVDYSKDVTNSEED